MSQTKVWSASRSTVVVYAPGLQAGCGGNTRLCAGHGGADRPYVYQSFVDFDADWLDVGKVVSAILTLTTDNGGGQQMSGAISAHPTISARRLTSAFVQGASADDVFVGDDWTDPSYSTTDMVGATPERVAGGLVNIDVTAMVRAWAPASVLGGGQAPNYGIGIYGTIDPDTRWTGWSAEAAEGLRPYLTVTYELGPTKPNVPTNLTPVGDTAVVSAFEGDFSDVKEGDTIARIEVAVYTDVAEATPLGVLPYDENIRLLDSNDLAVVPTQHVYALGDAVAIPGHSEVGEDTSPAHVVTQDGRELYLLDRNFTEAWSSPVPAQIAVLDLDPNIRLITSGPVPDLPVVPAHRTYLLGAAVTIAGHSVIGESTSPAHEVVQDGQTLYVLDRNFTLSQPVAVLLHDPGIRLLTAGDTAVLPTHRTYSLGPAITVPGHSVTGEATSPAHIVNQDGQDLYLLDRNFIASPTNMLVWNTSRIASDTEKVTAHFSVVPENLTLTADTTYKWQARYYDQEGEVSEWTALMAVKVTCPTLSAPVIAPYEATLDTLAGVVFKGDQQVGSDYDLQAYQIEMALYNQIVTDAHWKTLPLSWWANDHTEEFNAEPADWKLVGFDDSAWSPAEVVTHPWWPVILAGPSWLCDRTIYSTPALLSAIYLARTEFSIGSLPSSPVTLQYGALEIWLNGVLVASTAINGNAPVEINPSAFVEGINSLAIRTINGPNDHDYENIWAGGYASDPTGFWAMLDLANGASPWPEDMGEAAPATVWNTGKKFLPGGSKSWATLYGGKACVAGKYSLRMRYWAKPGCEAPWAYTYLILTHDFNPGSSDDESRIQLTPHSPWRIRIMEMDRVNGRGPGKIIAQFEHPKSVGASLVFNSGGEAHFTLPVDDPQVSLIEPRQVHYAIDFYDNDGWREVFAGLIWDYDADQNSAVFQGIDYLALANTVVDERYDPSDIDKTYANGGSKYTDMTIHDIIVNQIDRAIGLTDSPVGFITRGPIAEMNERVTIYSTMKHLIDLSTGLIDSHRQGTGKQTRVEVRRNSDGTYSFVVTDNPGVVRDNLRLRYGELVQGYRVIPFGKQWMSVMHMIGRSIDGLKVRYKTVSAPGIDQSVWGRISQVQLVDNVEDENDLERRAREAALQYSKLGRSMGLALRSGMLSPRSGYDICDQFPVSIKHGIVDTSRFGSGYWAAMAIAWEASDDGNQNTVLTLLPREDTTAPSNDLIGSQPFSTQKEWQVGWGDPEIFFQPGVVPSAMYLDQSTGTTWTQQISYTTDDGGVVTQHITYVPVIDANVPIGAKGDILVGGSPDGRITRLPYGLDGQTIIGVDGLPTWGYVTLEAVLAASTGEDIADALTGAASPSATNPFATRADGPQLVDGAIPSGQIALGTPSPGYVPAGGDNPDYPASWGPVRWGGANLSADSPAPSRGDVPIFAAGGWAAWVPYFTLDEEGVLHGPQDGGTVVVGFDGGGAPLSPGAIQDIYIRSARTITSWEMLADQLGAATVTVLRGTMTDLIAGTSPAESLTDGSDPELAAAIAAQDSTLAGWTKSLAAGDVLRFTLSAVDGTLTKINLNLITT